MICTCLGQASERSRMASWKDLPSTRMKPSSFCELRRAASSSAKGYGGLASTYAEATADLQKVFRLRATHYAATEDGISRDVFPGPYPEVLFDDEASRGCSVEWHRHQNIPSLSSHISGRAVAGTYNSISLFRNPAATTFTRLIGRNRTTRLFFDE